jgi:hypothetical protein
MAAVDEGLIGYNLTEPTFLKIINVIRKSIGENETDVVKIMCGWVELKPDIDCSTGLEAHLSQFKTVMRCVGLGVDRCMIYALMHFDNAAMIDMLSTDQHKTAEVFKSRGYVYRPIPVINNCLHVFIADLGTEAKAIQVLRSYIQNPNKPDLSSLK